MNGIPHEFAIGGVYLPPWLVAATIGMFAASLTASLLNRYRLTRFLFYPPIVYVSMMVIYTVLAGTILVPA